MLPEGEMLEDLAKRAGVNPNVSSPLDTEEKTSRERSQSSPPTEKHGLRSPTAERKKKRKTNGKPTPFDSRSRESNSNSRQSRARLAA